MNRLDYPLDMARAVAKKGDIDVNISIESRTYGGKPYLKLIVSGNSGPLQRYRLLVRETSIFRERNIMIDYSSLSFRVECRNPEMSLMLVEMYINLESTHHQANLDDFEDTRPPRPLPSRYRCYYPSA